MYVCKETHQSAWNKVFKCVKDSHTKKSTFFTVFSCFWSLFNLNFTILSQNSCFFMNVWSIFLIRTRCAIEFLISDSCCARKNEFKHIFFWIWPPRFESPTKVRHSVTPKCEKFRQIWLHQSMRRKKLGKYIQRRRLETIAYMRYLIYVVWRKPYFYQRYIYISLW